MNGQTDTPAGQGLTTAQVEERLQQGLFNKQENRISKSTGRIFRDNLMTFFNLINLILAILVLSVGSYKNAAFIGIVVCNTAIGIIQELRAKRTLDRLSLISAAKATVRRDGAERQIGIEEVVLGDILLLSAGNQICADSIVREGSLEVNEALITGESDVIVKHPGDRLYSGSFVVSGRAAVETEHVGADNFSYKLMSEAKVLKKHPSQLQKAINVILKVVSILIVPLGAGLFCSQRFLAGAEISDAIVNTVAAVLGMIPEGLVLLISIALAVGVINLGRRKTLVHELFCIETLARVDVLCLDKTGTLTEGRMAVEGTVLLEEGFPLEEVMGDLTAALEDDNATFLAVRERFPARVQRKALRTVPFSSARKYSGAVFEGAGTYLMGAYEFLFPEGEPALRARVEAYAKEGVRVLTVAHAPGNLPEMGLPAGLRPCALILLSDVVRSDARETLEFFQKQDVRLMVISGDNPATVSSIARKAGLPGAESYIDATVLRTPESIRAAVERYRIFGRVTPEQKKAIVQALKAQGHTVAMTGDGVNDVLALKEADCSIAMAAGSDAAKDCSNLVLLDSNFASMPYIVREGRRVINNIQSAASLFLVKTIFSVILTLFCLITGSAYPFVPIQLTVIGACTVGIPSFILSLEPTYSRIQGDFLRTVFRKAAAGALAVVLQVAASTVVCWALEASAEARATICMLATGITGLFMIGRVFPLQTLLRKAVYYTMFLLFFGILFTMPAFFDLVDIGFRETIFLLAVALLTPAILQWMERGIQGGERLLEKIGKKRKGRKAA
ncbi:MAG: cation-translocating P-type ATPase [Candidatus Merdivicinus sp.]|jgi:cation-transporting ATPase E